MIMSLKSFLPKIPILTFLFMMLIFKLDVAAADTVWQNDYEYEVFDPNNIQGMSRANIEYMYGLDPLIMLTHYKGAQTSINIPASATIDGKVLRTCIGSIKNNSGPFFNNNSGIVSISFEPGCIEGYSDFLANCQNLKTLELTGLERINRQPAGLIKTDDCINLEYLNLSGVYFAGSRDILANCKNLKKITTPAKTSNFIFNDHEKTLLPYAMFVYQNGAYTGKPYLYLEDAPPNTLIAAKDADAKKDKAIIKYKGLKYKVLSSQRKEVELVGPVKKCPSNLIIDDSITDSNGIIYHVKSIGKKAFFGNKQLKKLKIYNNGITIKSNAFSECRKLKEVYIEDHNAVLKPQAFKSSGIKKVEFYGAYVFTVGLVIGKEAFKDCSSLSEIKFDGLWRMEMKKTIKKDCFKGIKSKARIKFSGAEGPGLPLEHFKDFHPKGKAIVKYINKYGGASNAEPVLPTA